MIQRILVVDDGDASRRLLSRYLEPSGHTVETVDNPNDALEMIGKGFIDVVLTDRAMPVMSGDDLAKRIRDVSPDTAGGTLPSFVGGFAWPYNPSTCQTYLSTVAQVPSGGACGFPVADDY